MNFEFRLSRSFIDGYCLTKKGLLIVESGHGVKELAVRELEANEVFTVYLEGIRLSNATLDNMSSLLGLAGYDSDHSDGDDANNQQQTPPQDEAKQKQQLENGGYERSPPIDNINSSSNKFVSVALAGGVGDLEEAKDGQLGDRPGDDGGSGDREARARVLRASSFDAPAPPSKESRPFFMPLPSPLVRLDNASPITNSPFITYDPFGSDQGVAGEEGREGEGAAATEKVEEEDADTDIIKPKYRDMLPPEATGQANSKLQAKIAKFLDTMQGDFTKSIKGKKDYGNPAVLAQVRHEELQILHVEPCRAM